MRDAPLFCFGGANSARMQMGPIFQENSASLKTKFVGGPSNSFGAPIKGKLMAKKQSDDSVSSIPGKILGGKKPAQKEIKSLAAFAERHNVVNLDIRRAVRLVKTIVAITNHAIRPENVAGLYRPTLVVDTGFNQMFRRFGQNARAFRQQGCLPCFAKACGQARRIAQIP